MTVGAILFASFRATPETEPETTQDMIQPISDLGNKLILIHNGGVTDSIKNQVRWEYLTPLDSEAILAYYINNHRNMVSAMEDLSGSFAFVMLDKEKNKLFVVNSFLPLAHMYIKGYGYFIHSDNECLGKVLHFTHGTDKDGMNVWESWYHHDLEGYTVYETDLDSGAQTKREYTPRFLHPKWDSLAPTGHASKTFVVASGGVDSGLTAHILNKAGHDVSMLHFDYGQKSEEAEAWAINKLSHALEIPSYTIDLKSVYQQLLDPSMLLEKNIKVTSGGDDIKSTIAWVAGRNAIFASLAMAFAETAILNYNYSRVYLAAGWAQLSEETGGYPDNSYKFNQAINELKKYGYITGSRIHFLPVLQNLTKTECWQLGAALKFPFKYTVSCDNPQMLPGQPILCSECGSTQLSIIAADRAGVRDLRCFDNVIGYCNRKPQQEPAASHTPQSLINRLIIDYAAKKKLLEIV